MKRLKLQITQMAQRQIEVQVLYIAEHSIDHALDWENRLRAAIHKLRNFHGHVIDEEVRKRLGLIVRKTVFEKTYLIHYIVDENAGMITVINFRHGARLPGTAEP